MQGCCLKSQISRQRKCEAIKKLFNELINAIWHGDVREVVKVLLSDRSLANYRSFTFHLPEKSTSILAYATACHQPAIVQVLQGFGGRR